MKVDNLHFTFDTYDQLLKILIHEHERNADNSLANNLVHFWQARDDPSTYLERRKF